MSVEGSQKTPEDLA